MTFFQKMLKRLFDLLVSFIGIIIFSPIILITFIIASIETKSNGFYFQKRVGKNAKLFYVIKIKTMDPKIDINSTITTNKDPRITKSGAFFRKYKLDELPQLINVFLGQMSFVGPRPDVPGYADKLVGEDRIILSIRPGITGPASLKYKDEEIILSRQEDPIKYNNEVIYPDKVIINKEYIKNYSLLKDVKYIIRTII